MVVMMMMMIMMMMMMMMINDVERGREEIVVKLFSSHAIDNIGYTDKPPHKHFFSPLV